MKYCLLLFITVSGLFSCNQGAGNLPQDHAAMKARMDSLREDLLKTDLLFSELSEQKGRDSAFTANLAENATVLRPYNMPLTGKDSIMTTFKAHPDSSYKLTWVPIRAEVAHSGELGFTYGTYTLEIKGQGKEDGTYCTIWKKDKQHNWKIILDTGNEGLSPEEKK